MEKKPDEKKEEGVEIKIDTPFVRWIENFWYHYKWHTIIAVFFLIVVIFCVTQQVSDPKQDTLVTYCGSYIFANNEIIPIQNALSDTLIEDFDGNGDKYSGFARYEIFSEEEMETLRLENNGESVVNAPYNASQFSTFNQFLMTGECSVYLCSPYIFNVMLERGIVASINTIDENLNLFSEDGYSIPLAKTYLYKKYSAVRVLPDDTVVCMTVPFAWGTNSSEENYEIAKMTFQSIVEKREE